MIDLVMFDRPHGQQAPFTGERMRQLAAALSPVGALAATAALIAIAAMTAMSAGGCAVADPCSDDDDCFSGAACFDGWCAERLRRPISSSDARNVDVDGFFHAEELTIPAGKVTDDLVGFPVLITIVDRELRHVDSDGFVRSIEGDDIAFFDRASLDAAAALPREIESFDPESGALTVWVRVPVIRADDDTPLVIAWGHELDTLAPPVDVARVWQGNYAAVWHLEAIADDAVDGPHMKDSLDLSFARALGLTSSDAVPGLVGRGMRFTDPLACLEIPPATVRPTSVDVETGITIEAWGRIDTGDEAGENQVGGRLYHRGEPEAPAVLDMFVAPGPSAAFVVEGAPPALASTDTAVFHHYAGVFGDGRQLFYVDGTAHFDEAAPVERLATGAPTHIGNSRAGNGEPFGGVLDEVRVAARPLSAAWIRAVADNARDPASFVVRAR